MIRKDMTHLSKGASSKKDQHYNTYNKINVNLSWDDEKGKKVPNFGDTWGQLPQDKANATAILTGNGLVVVDIDTKDLKTLDKNLVKMLGEPTVETARGYHYYFNVPDSTLFTTCSNISDKVDIRSEGGLVFNEYWGDDKWIMYKKVGEAIKMPKKLSKYILNKNASKSKKRKNKFQYNNTDKKKMKELLSYITCYDEYDGWYQVGMALKSWDSEEGFKLWDKWSRQSNSYDGDTKYKWSTFADNGNLGVGTLYHLAKQGGYVIPHEPVFPKREGRVSVQHENNLSTNFMSVTANQNKSNPLSSFKELGMTESDYKKIANQKYFINQFLPIGGLFMFAGDSGSGKSWLAFMVTKRVLQSYKDATCIFIDLDSGATYTKNRVYSLWEEFGKDKFTYVSQTKTDSREVVEHLKNIPDSNLDNTIIVIDSLVGITDGNINESSVIKPILTLFEGLRNAGATVVLIHHIKKAVDKDAIPIYAGSFTIKAAMDALYMVVKDNHTITCHLNKARGDYVGRTFEIMNFEEMEAKDINYISPEEEAKIRREKAQEYEDKNIRHIILFASNDLTKEELKHELRTKYKYSYRRAQQAIDRAIKTKLIQEKTVDKNKKKMSLVGVKRT